MKLLRILGGGRMLPSKITAGKFPPLSSYSQLPSLETSNVATNSYFSRYSGDLYPRTAVSFD